MLHASFLYTQVNLHTHDIPRVNNPLGWWNVNSPAYPVHFAWSCNHRWNALSHEWCTRNSSAEDSCSSDFPKDGDSILDHATLPGMDWGKSWANLHFMSVNVATLPNSSIRFNSSTGWIMTNSRAARLVVLGKPSLWLWYLTLTVRILSSLPTSTDSINPNW